MAIYSGQSTELVTGYDGFVAPPPVKFVERRRFARIRCKNVKACIKLGEGLQAVVDVLNISRGGVCFTSREKYSVGAIVSIATHYIAGGFNIFQDAQIVRFRLPESSPETAPIEYAIEFFTDQRPAK